MENKKNAMSLLATVMLATFALSGCTSGDKAPVPMPEPSNTESSQDNAKIFEQQKSNVEGTATSGLVLKQFSGTGPSTIHVGSLPEGYKQVGTTVACTGAGDWEASIVQTEPAWSKSGCSLEAVGSALYSLDEPAKDHSVEVKVEADAQIWITIFATK
ncbi:hypothetical protein [Paeniglutamicibacter kerguelensis]|uniref:Uncharacterized protein n=1 Tax=Paeniglutamicibacter kerguelensis TaxID=254788 RepID=A0ABS4XBK5_9MICC|nr:hypothetical protein [Paeniglutamicibacter kerguelensis]MBP2385862.1 hypothetical protein [Paeniglutamicibacter kerguelensis]